MASTKLKNKKKIVCLGGGIGTVNLIKGIKDHFDDITVILSMADDGGSAGRLRRLYNILPPGDLVSCMAAFINDKDPFLSKLLTYRFPGDRYGKDTDLSGHKLGNLIMVALRDLTGNFEHAIVSFQDLFHIPGTFLPATIDPVVISAKTTEGKEVHGEETIDLGSFSGKKQYDLLTLHPQNVHANKHVMKKLKDADVIIAGPGDLYSTVLPVLIIQDIQINLQKTKAKKLLIVNITNQPEETEGYTAEDYLHAIKKHIGDISFDAVITNNNNSIPISSRFKNSYVVVRSPKNFGKSTLISTDVIDESFPLYHDPHKLAKVIVESI